MLQYVKCHVFNLKLRWGGVSQTHQWSCVLAAMLAAGRCHKQLTWC